MESLEISSDGSRLDVAMIHAFLSASYWGKDRSKALVERSLANSTCFGGYLESGQVAFGRIVTDTVVLAYLADVFVLPDYRGRGYGKALVARMLEYIDELGVFVSLLRTKDAHGLYERFGFESRSDSLGMMRRSRRT